MKLKPGLIDINSKSFERAFEPYWREQLPIFKTALNKIGIKDYVIGDYGEKIVEMEKLSNTLFKMSFIKEEMI